MVDETKQVLVVIKGFTPNKKQELINLSKHRGLNLSAMCRMILFEELRNAPDWQKVKRKD